MWTRVLCIVWGHEAGLVNLSVVDMHVLDDGFLVVFQSLFFKLTHFSPVLDVHGPRVLDPTIVNITHRLSESGEKRKGKRKSPTTVVVTLSNIVVF